MNFAAFIEDIQRNNWNVHGVEVYEKGQLIHSYGDTDDNIYDIYSATKTVLSLAAGLAYDRDLINLNESIIRYLPADKVANMSSSQKEIWSKISIKRLLTMSVDGLPFRPEGESYIDYSLSCTINKPDEAVFNYCNICAYLVGVALTEAFQEDLARVIEDNIFKPIGIEKYEYGRSPEGYFYGASQMKLTVHDLSKIGLLLLNKGTYCGKRIISEEYVKMATSIQQMNKAGGYGYFIWKYQDGFSINGKWKQRCFCLPERGLVITFLSHIEEESDDILVSMELNVLTQ